MEELNAAIERWHGIAPSNFDAGFREANIPTAVQQFYRSYNGRLEELFSYYSILPSESLKKSGDYIQFCIESSGAFNWSFDMNDDDPKVFFCSASEDSPTSEEVAFTEFLTPLVYHEAVMKMPFTFLSLWQPHSHATEIVTHFNTLDWKIWRMNLAPTKFYQLENSIALTWPSSNGMSFYCGGKNLEELEFLRQFIDDNWEHSAFNLPAS